MILNIRNASSINNTPIVNNFMNDSRFLKQNRITINQVKQSHFTVQGVQSYTADQLKAIKNKQDKNYQNKQGVFIQPKIYHVSEDLENQVNQEQQAKQKKIKLMYQSTIKNRPQTAKHKNNQIKQPVKMFKQKSAKEKYQMNNNVLTKLNKHMNKKSALQTKLQKLSKQYKKYFKGDGKNKEQQVNKDQNQEQIKQNKGQQFQQFQEENDKSSLCQSILSITKGKKGNNQQDQQEENKQDQNNSQQQDQQNQSQFTNKNKPSTAVTSNKNNKKKMKNDQKISQNSNERFQDDISSICSKQNKVKISKNKSSYSQKLGSAVHLLFK